MTDDGVRFPTSPRGQRHLFAVCRFDPHLAGDDPTTAFVLTRGYWSESDANLQAERLNAEARDSTYFVLPVRVAEAD